MKEINCRQLDDYLDGSLSADEHAQFERHAQQCKACGKELRLERRLVTLARRGADREVIPPSVTLAARTGIRRAVVRRRVTGIAYLVAALVLLVLVLSDHWAPRSTQQPSREAAGPVAQPSRELAGSPTPQEVNRSGQAIEGNELNREPDVAFVPAIVRIAEGSAQDYIAIPQSQHDSPITFVMLYPTIKPNDSLHEPQSN